MDIRVIPSPLSGRIEAPPSKAYAQRALLCAALCEKPSVVALGGLSEDVRAMLGCIKGLGCSVEYLDQARVRVHPARASGRATLDCGESGATLRFMLPVAAALDLRATFTGRGTLPGRPIGTLLNALSAHGVSFDSGALPLSISGRLNSGVYPLPGDESSQYISGLLFALPLLPGDSRIKLLTPLQSGGYVDMTIGTLERFGIRIERTPTGFFVPGGQAYRCNGEFSVEGDWSNAAFWLVAGAIGGGVKVAGLNAASLQKDRAILTLLGSMGAKTHIDENGAFAGPGSLTAAAIDATDIPDLVPILSVAAALCEGETRIYGAKRLKIKESDRLFSTRACLSRIGAEIFQTDDGLLIRGKKRFSGGESGCFADHRLAMCLSVAAGRSDGDIVIRGAEAVNKSYPAFFDAYRDLGGAFDVL